MKLPADGMAYKSENSNDQTHDRGSEETNYNNFADRCGMADVVVIDAPYVLGYLSLSLVLLLIHDYFPLSKVLVEPCGFQTPEDRYPT
jgi:hypothetical protein